MGLTGFDIYLISPELSLVVVAIGVILFGQSMGKALVVPCALLGLIIPLVFSFLLWSGAGSSPEVGFNGGLILDRFALFLKILLLGVLGLLFMASKDSIIHYDRLRAEFIGLIMLSTAGMMMLAGAARRTASLRTKRASWK